MPAFPLKAMLLGATSKTITLIKKMNWTAQHIGLGFTLFFLFGIFYRMNVARKLKAKECEDDKEIPQKQSSEPISKSSALVKSALDSPIKVNQESSRYTRKSKPKFHYPALRKYRAPSTLKGFSKQRANAFSSTCSNNDKRQELNDAVSKINVSNDLSNNNMELINEKATFALHKKDEHFLMDQAWDENRTGDISQNSIRMIFETVDKEYNESKIDTDIESGKAKTSENATIVHQKNNDTIGNDSLQDGLEKSSNHWGKVKESCFAVEKDSKFREYSFLGNEIDRPVENINLDLLQGNAPSAEIIARTSEFDSNAKDRIDDILKILKFESADDDILSNDKAGAIMQEKISRPLESKSKDVHVDHESIDQIENQPIEFNDREEKELEDLSLKFQKDVAQEICHIIPSSDGENIDFQRELNLQNQNMIEIPQIIRQTFGPHLKILNISSNYLEILPLEICYLTGLEFLYLRKNHLKKIPLEFSNLKSLQICDLAENNLEEIPHDTFCCDKLQILDLSKNKLRNLPYSLGMLRNLRSLMLDNNCFQSHLKTLVEPLEYAYENGSPIKGHLFRIKGYLQDLYDTQSAPLRKVIAKTSSRVPATSSLKLIYFDESDLHQSKSLATEKRRKIIQELYETEETYVQQLDDVYRLYMIPLSNFTAFSKIHYELLFSNLDDIRYLHKRLILPAFREIECKSFEMSVGKLFSSICPILMIYKEYFCNDLATSLLRRINDGFDEKMSILDWIPLPENALNKFNKVQEMALLDSKHSQLNLASYLLLPVQRLPRYNLLLKALLHSTEESHPDYPLLIEAIYSFSQLLSFFNESKKETESNQEKTSQLYKLQIPPTNTLNMTFLFTSQYQNRKFLREFSDILILKYLKRKDSGFKKFMPFSLAKKSQITIHEKDDCLVEYKFKVVKDANSTAKGIGIAGPISKFDVNSILGKKCKIYITIDLLLIANSNHELIGFVSLPLSKRVTIIPQTYSMAHLHTPQAVMRIDFGEELMYLKGSMDQLNHFSNII